MNPVSRFAVGTALLAAALAPTAGTAQDIQNRQLKVGHLSTDDSTNGQGLLKWAELVEARSGGKLRMKVYGSGQLGSEVQQMGALQGGSQDFTLISSSPLMSAVRDLQILDFPGLLQSPEIADRLLDGPIGQEMLEKFKDKNLVGVGFFENGFRQFTNSKRRIRTVEDFAGLKVRVIQNPIYIDMFKSLKTNPVPMSFTQLYTALETRTVDAQDNAMSTNYMAKFDEVQKYLTLTRHIYNPMVLIGSKKTWDALSEAERAILTETFAEARTFQRQLNRAKERDYIEAARQNGMTVDEFPPAEAARMRELMMPVVAKYTKDLGEPFVKRVYAEVERLSAATQ